MFAYVLSCYQQNKPTLYSIRSFIQLPMLQRWLMAIVLLLVESRIILVDYIITLVYAYVQMNIYLICHLWLTVCSMSFVYIYTMYIFLE